MISHITQLKQYYRDLVTKYKKFKYLIYKKN